MQLGKTLTLMVRSAENAAESRAACLEEAAFWQNRESMGVCRELAKTIPEAGAGHRWWCDRHSRWEASDGQETLEGCVSLRGTGHFRKEPRQCWWQTEGP